jgi:iron complex outermembrane receptor protein
MQRVSSRDRPTPEEGVIARSEPSPPQQASTSDRITLSLRHVSLKTALREIDRRSSVTLFYNDADLDGRGVVSIDTSGVSEFDAVHIVLRGTGLTARADDAGIWIEREAEDRPAPERVDSTGSVSGRVTDSTSGASVEGARVSLDGTSLDAVSGKDGRFRIAGVEPGTHVITARRLGYLPSSRSVTVNSGSETIADIHLAPAPRTLDQVVTTGTIIPTNVRKLPTPISIITESEIAAQHPRTLGEILRETVPGMLAWDQGNYPQNTSFSVRGAASMSASSMKVYIDGVEIADRTSAAIDPTSIERIEVIRGPQAATIYGSDAISGVIQVFTKRGDRSGSMPRIEASTAWGAVQTGYAGSEPSLRQEYSATVQGAGNNFSYNLGASYTHLGDWIPEGRRSLPSVYGGISVEQGDFTIDVSGRSNQQHLMQNASPIAANTGYPTYSKPFYTDASAKQESFGTRIAWSPTVWLHQNLTVGVDRALSENAQRQPRLITPADTLLSFSESSNSKRFIAYTTSASGTIGSHVDATITAGIDHYDQDASTYFTSGATSVTGSVITVPSRPITGSRDKVANTGYFAQLSGTLWSAVALTAGVRAERNSAIGEDVGVPVSPRVGIAYSFDFGAAAVKLRSSYGEAILPPSPRQTQPLALAGGSFLLGNPDLKPQRQHGWDAGVDVSLGRSVSAGITYYDQTASDLIQFVTVTPPVLEFQYQNVGRIRNSGLELEATVDIGPTRATGQFAVTDSKVAELSPIYTGDLRAGDRPLLVPKYTGGATLTVTPRRRTTLTAGLKYVGSFRNYDSFAQLSCAVGTGECLPSARDYIVEYPGFVKLDLGATQRLAPWVSAFVSVRNVANNMAAEKNNVNVAIMGRITMAGMELTF